jgi:ribosomal protein S18 acetylase RimI-like enzyme
MTIAPVRPTELAEAFALLGGEAGAVHAFRLVARGELDPADLLVAMTDGSVRGAVYAAKLPGSIGVIWPPQTRGGDSALEDALTAAALRRVAGMKVVQAFLGPGEMDRAAVLSRAGFRMVTRVLEMRFEGAADSDDCPLPFELIPFADSDLTAFRDILARSHNDSLDCPELNGLRTPQEIYQGYCDCAPDQSLWFLACRNGVPVGVIILARGTLAFVGVAPEYRRKGFGRALVVSACRRMKELSLIVDERNTPAIQLYFSLKFKVLGARAVYLLSFS